MMLWNVSAVCSTLSKIAAQHGILSSALFATDRVGHRLCRLHVQHVVWLVSERLRLETEQSDRFVFRFLEMDEVNRFAIDPSLDLNESLTTSNRPGRNLCFAALEGDRLAAYGWYALDVIEPEHVFGVGMKLPSDVAYMYKGFTHPDYRGLRLHAITMGLALLALEQQGVRGLISTVEWTNFASLKSCNRLGYRRVGRIVQWTCCGRRRCRCTRFADQFGVELIPPGETSAPVDLNRMTCIRCTPSNNKATTQ